MPAAAREFATTHWSVVAAGGHDTPGGREALARLCQVYWFPLYAFIRRRGESPHNAEDLTQGFFASLLQRKALAVADPDRGRFRSFLLASLKHFLANERARTRAQKRGGDQIFVTLDDPCAELRYAAELVVHLTPERIFEQQWARTVLAQALAQLRQEYVAAGKSPLFDSLKECLTAEKHSSPYAQLAAQNRMSEGAVKVAVHRLRQRYRALLRDAVAQTLVDTDDVDQELRLLLSALGS